MPTIDKEKVQFIQQFLQREIRESGADPAAFGRLVRGLEISSGLRPRPEGPPLHAPLLLYFPELTATPFPDPADFPSARVLEDHYETIKGELMDLLAERERLAEHSRTEGLVDEGWWKEFRFYHGGRPYPDNHQRCPRTAEILESIPDRTPMGKVFFSVAGPHTHIEPHCGPNNIRLRCHLGMIIPEGSEIRSGEEKRVWQEGKVLMLDDSFEHEVWNRSDEERAVLIVDVWHPQLTALERGLIAKLTDIMLEAEIQAA
jgi:aspartyl/asparaginyl beta-hydroxylase (cupin superfamily)